MWVSAYYACALWQVSRALNLDLRAYATTTCLKDQGGVYLRPYHIPFSKTSGLKGIIESDTGMNIDMCPMMSCQIYCFAGFQKLKSDLQPLRTNSCKYASSLLCKGSLADSKRYCIMSAI